MTQRTWKPTKVREALKMTKKLTGWEVIHKHVGGEYKFFSPDRRCFVVGHNSHYIPMDLARALYAQMREEFPTKKG